MTEFKNVTIAKEANFYFDGNVTSRTIFFSDGSKKTLGIMLPGNYEFTTEVKEIVEITEGWKKMVKGMQFEVDKNSTFKLKVTKAFDYCCSYIEE
jgi:uncharacterized protein YaiE (UPF0345 family)